MSSGGDSTTVTFDAIWGTLQPGKPLGLRNHYLQNWNDSLPLTVTCNIGTMMVAMCQLIHLEKNST